MFKHQISKSLTFIFVYFKILFYKFDISLCDVINPQKQYT